ncbi:hypothetical protein FKM82_021036 [Ascaphus truei]
MSLFWWRGWSESIIHLPSLASFVAHIRKITFTHGKHAQLYHLAGAPPEPLYSAQGTWAYIWVPLLYWGAPAIPGTLCITADIF